MPNSRFDFSKDCRAKLKFADYLENAISGTWHLFSISIERFEFDFMEDASLSSNFIISLLNLELRELKLSFKILI